jgi:hypothetical protein
MVCGFAAVSDAQEVAKKVDKGTPDAIAWFASWKQGLASAEQTNRPILLIAAAPHCHNISGMW